MATALEQAMMALSPLVPRQSGPVTDRGQYRRAARRALAAKNGWQYNIDDPAQQEQYKAYHLLPHAAGDTRESAKFDPSAAGRALANQRHHGNPDGPASQPASPVAQAILSGNPGALAALARALQQG